MAVDLDKFFEDYDVNELGVVVSKNSNWRGYGQRIMTQGTNSHGYPSVRVKIDGKTKHLTVHRLVAHKYLGNKPSDKCEIRHMDGNKLNNNFSNLEWGTAKENAKDREKHGTTFRKYAIGHRGFPPLLGKTKPVAIGQVWRASNTELLRYALVIDVKENKVRLHTVEKTNEGIWEQKPRAKKKWSNMNRFHGMRDGYEFIEEICT